MSCRQPRHTRHRLILVYQPSSFAPVKPPATACFPLKNSLFILSGDREFALRSIVFSLPHAPLIIPLMDHNSHCALHLCVCGLVCGNYLREDTFRAPWGNFLSWFYPLVACPTSCSPISFPDPQTAAALMWHHRVVYLAGTPSWSEYRWSLAACLWFLCDLSGYCGLRLRKTGAEGGWWRYKV